MLYETNIPVGVIGIGVRKNEKQTKRKMKYELYRDSVGEYRWRLKASNGAIISVSSEGYVRKADCEHSIVLNKSSYNAPVYDMAAA